MRRRTMSSRFVHICCFCGAVQCISCNSKSSISKGPYGWEKDICCVGAKSECIGVDIL